MCLLLAMASTKAQFVKAELQASGLTCSMCSFATEKSLKTLNFIDSIGHDLNHTTFILYFKKDVPVDLDKIRQKVEDAGFSVAKLLVTFRFDQEKIANNYHYRLGDNLYHFINVKEQVFNGQVVLQVIDKGFISDKLYNKYSKHAQGHQCYQTGKMPEQTDVRRVYHVTMI
jgi:copper chaperone CopZ